MLRFLWGAIALAIFAASASAQDFSAERMDHHIRTLSDDSFEGRAPATVGERMTVAYLSGAFAAVGLEPGGDLRTDGTRAWTQDVILNRSVMVEAPELFITMGGERVAMVQEEDLAIRAPVNGSKRVELDDVPLIFVGYGAHAPERNWSDFKDVDVEGKVIVALVNDPDFETGEGEFGGEAMTYYGRWTYKYEEAARRGAAGVLVIHETEPASYPWGVIASGNDTTLDIVREDPAAAHSALQGWMHVDIAQRLFEAIGTSYEEAKGMAQQRDFQPMDLDATIEATLVSRKEKITAKNVVGILPGSRRPDEHIVFTAHHDHMGVGQPDETGDAIYNGAIDNATGLALMIEMGRAFVEAGGTDRSLVFLAVGAEESGLLGARYYAANPLYPLATTVGVINTDAPGVHGRTRDFSISGSARLGLLDLLIEEAEQRGRAYTPDPNPAAGSFFRSDHFAFAQVGVPAVSFRSGSDLVEGGTERAAAISRDYMENDYHQQSDEWSPDWDLSGMVADAELIFAVAERLGNSREWPNWAEGSEFKALRDASAAARPSGASN
ncbi:MAG: M28 family peptidase [Wenzhouxiangella sp.]|jgi:Zn-dependent M28 family amino/carboxypeptidase|nr:M28 family peptidase [Wenzhouxiangella sp.]